MSIELITGKSATAHISANDFRAVNRANYGPGRYILKDADNMQTQISAQGTIYIGRGSLMWSGMHIRCEDPTTLKFTPPTTRENIEVYLHYVKDVETLNESVEWVVSVGKELTPIIDNVADNTMEAYTLFCFASMFADGTMGDTRYKFNLLDCHEDFDLSTIEQKYEDITGSRLSDVYSRLNLLEKEPVLYNGNELINGSIIVNFSEKFVEYKYLTYVFVGDYDGFSDKYSQATITVPRFVVNNKYYMKNHYKIYFDDGEVDVNIELDDYQNESEITSSKVIRLVKVVGTN